jgi:hypothetical protein
MSDGEVAADVIEVIETGIFKTEHVFQSPTQVFGSLVLKAGKSSGTFTGADEGILEFLKHGFWKARYELRKGSAVLGSTAPRGKLNRDLLISFGGEDYGLFQGGKKIRSWRIIKEDRVLCEISPRGAFKKGAILQIFSPVPFNLLLFSYCLVSKRWQEQSSSM